MKRVLVAAALSLGFLAASSASASAEGTHWTVGPDGSIYWIVVPDGAVWGSSVNGSTWNGDIASSDDGSTDGSTWNGDIASSDDGSTDGAVWNSTPATTSGWQMD